MYKEKILERVEEIFMGKIITLASLKGGVAKTTTTALLGYGLFHRGFKVLLVDMDSQRNLSKWVNAKYEDVPTSFEVLTGECTAEDAIQHLDCFSIIPGSNLLSKAEIALPLTGKLKRLKRALKDVKDKFDYVVIDTGPNLGILTVNALIAADEVIVPSIAAAFSIEGFLDLYSLISDIRIDDNPDLEIKGVLITMYTPRTNIANKLATTIEEINEKYGVKTFESRIRASVSVLESQTFRFDIFDVLPNNIVATDFNQFLDEYLKEGDNHE